MRGAEELMLALLARHAPLCAVNVVLRCVRVTRGVLPDLIATRISVFRCTLADAKRPLFPTESNNENVLRWQ